jgi:hypothetical protein
MSRSDSPGNKPNQNQSTLHDLLDQSNRAIEQSRAEVARSKALSRSEADLARAINQISKEEAGSSYTREE